MRRIAGQGNRFGPNDEIHVVSRERVAAALISPGNQGVARDEGVGDSLKGWVRTCFGLPAGRPVARHDHNGRAHSQYDRAAADQDDPIRDVSISSHDAAPSVGVR
jgi:hypothetical protein